ALHTGGIPARPRPQILHDGAPDLRERHLFVRSQREGRPRRLRRHHRAQFQTAERGPRPRQHAVVAHVAHADVADTVFVIARVSRPSERPYLSLRTTWRASAISGKPEIGGSLSLARPEHEDAATAALLRPG